MWPANVTGTLSASPPQPILVSIDDRKCEPEKTYNEVFSKSVLLEKLVQYYAGKYTKRYIETYIEFCHLSGYLSNLDYLDIKEKMSKE